MAKLTIAARVLPDGSTFTVIGRIAWAMGRFNAFTRPRIADLCVVAG